MTRTSHGGAPPGLWEGHGQWSGRKMTTPRDKDLSAGQAEVAGRAWLRTWSPQTALLHLQPTAFYVGSDVLIYLLAYFVRIGTRGISALAPYLESTVSPLPTCPSVPPHPPRGSRLWPWVCRGHVDTGGGWDSGPRQPHSPPRAPVPALQNPAGELLPGGPGLHLG